MHLKEMVRTLSFRKSRSSRQSESFVLAETLTSQSMRIAKYEDLSKSLRFEDFGMDEQQCNGDFKEAPRSGSFRWISKLRSMSRNEQQQPESYGDFKEAPKSGSFRWSSKLKFMSHNDRRTAKFSFGSFSQRQMKPAHEMKEAKVKVQKRNSWLPDPNRRWPVQGCVSHSLPEDESLAMIRKVDQRAQSLIQKILESNSQTN